MDVNYFAILLCGIASMVLGFIWYGPILFGNVWMKEIGLSEKEINAGPGIGYFLTFLAALLMAVVTSVLLSQLGVTELSKAIQYGLLLGLGYVGTTFASNYIFGRKTLKLYLIDAGYQVLNVTIAAIIVTLL
jgi:multidrug transporter EmrE-like cation transporter